MSLTDPVADFLTRVRNAINARHQKVDVPLSKLKLEMARILKDEGYIANFKSTEEEGRKVLRVYLKYGADNSSPISQLKRWQSSIVTPPGLSTKKRTRLRRPLPATSRSTRVNPWASSTGAATVSTASASGCVPFPTDTPAPPTSCLVPESSTGRRGAPPTQKSGQSPLLPTA